MSEATQTVPPPAEAKPIRRPRYVPEGYSEPHEFPEWGIRIVYRPLLGFPFAKYVGDLAKADSPEAILKIECEMLAKQIVSWDLKDDNGEAVPVTAEVMQQLEPQRFRTQLIEFVCGLNR